MAALLPCRVGCAFKGLDEHFLNWHLSEYALRNRDVEGYEKMIYSRKLRNEFDVVRYMRG
jgi:hypothetical protein